MAVYVDRMNIRAFGHTFTAHMVADTHDELEEMAHKLGLKPNWMHKRGRPLEHYDLVESKRRKAVEYGAIEVTSKEMGRILSTKLEDHNDAASA